MAPNRVDIVAGKMPTHACPAPLTDNNTTAAGFDVEVAANEAVANPVKVANLAGLAKTR